MDVDDDGGRREFGLRGQRRGTGSDKGTAANSLSGYHAAGLKRFWLVCSLGHEITKLGVKLLCEPWSRNALVVAHYLVNVRIDLRVKDKPHQLRRFSIRWSSSSNVMPRDGFASNSASRRRASAIPSSSSCRTDESDPSRCAARTALSVSGKSSASFSTSALVAIGASLVSTVSKARTHQKTAT